MILDRTVQEAVFACLNKAWEYGYLSKTTYNDLDVSSDKEIEQMQEVDVAEIMSEFLGRD